MKVIAPTKHHAIEIVRHLINIDCIQTHFDDVHLDCQVVGVKPSIFERMKDLV
jgi:hypothetical protein